MQGDSAELHMEGQALLMIDQLRTERPSVFCQYAEPDAVIVYKNFVCKVSDVERIMESPPTSILWYDPDSNTLSELTAKVCNHYLVLSVCHVQIICRNMNIILKLIQ